MSTVDWDAGFSSTALNVGLFPVRASMKRTKASVGDGRRRLGEALK